MPQDDPTQRCPDITRANQLLNWQPTIPLREGLERTGTYFAERLKRWRPARARDSGPPGAGAAGLFVERRAFSGLGDWTDRQRL